MPQYWYWFLILGILIGWVVSWLLDLFCWRRKRNRVFEKEIQELKSKLDDCNGRAANLRGEIEKRDARIADLERTLAARVELHTAAVPTAHVEAEPLPVHAHPIVMPEAPEVHPAASQVVVSATQAPVKRPHVPVAAPVVDLAAPEAALASVGVTLAGPPAAAAAAPVVAAPAPAGEFPVDDLTKVRGIGPMLTAALHAGGITSFAQLAAADEAQLQSIIQAPEWRRLDYGDWIEQAKALRDQPAEPAEDDLTRIEGIGPKYAEELRAAGIGTFGELASSNPARLAGIVKAPDWRRVDYASWIDQARLVVAGDEGGLATLQDRLHRRQGDNLTLIAGIGPRAAAALSSAGIDSYAALAATDEAYLAGIMDGAELRAGDYPAWLGEARMRAAGKRVVREVRPVIPATPIAGIPAQDLAAIRGIGPVFEQKLYEAGVGTFARLAALSDEQVRAIIQPEEWQEFDYESWNEQARNLAERTDTVDALWNGIIPDDLSKIKGIGEVTEQKLYEAGILNFTDLATTTVQRLQEIIQPEPWQKMDFAAWIEEARRLAV
jgi:predicted flap endonuclease-1-like 5' DNA nuclease